MSELNQCENCRISVYWRMNVRLLNCYHFSRP